MPCGCGTKGLPNRKARQLTNVALMILHLPGDRQDRRGRVRWLGCDWKGVPEPLRWELRRRGVKRPGGLPGCGCHCGAKRAWLRLRWAWRGWTGR